MNEECFVGILKRREPLHPQSFLGVVQKGRRIRFYPFADAWTKPYSYLLEKVKEVQDGSHWSSVDCLEKEVKPVSEFMHHLLT